jgi:iron complex outermembrane receptor protein
MRGRLLETLLPGRFAAALVATTALTAPAMAQQPSEVLPTIDVTASRLFGNTVTGTSTTVITAEDIARAPSASLQEIIAQAPGVQLRSLYGGVGGAGTVVDLRGFGAAATSNTLVLVNGRRVNDIDVAGVDFAAIPREAIERIEITRGNSGAVLYGDNAVGGVINIVTKTGASVGKPASLRVEGGVGSFNQRVGSIAATVNSGPFSTAIFSNGLQSDGYRANNRLVQRNVVGEIRYAGVDFSAFFNISADDQELGLPGTRAVNPAFGINELATDRRGTSTPLDYGNKQGVNATAGFTYKLSHSVELIVDGGVRDKKQQAGFFWPAFPPFPAGSGYTDAHLQTWSLTPRLNITRDMFGLRSRILTGFDYYDADYVSPRGSGTVRGMPDNVYNLGQRTYAAYWQQTLGLTPATDFSYGARWQRADLRARETGPLASHAPFDSTDDQYAWHVGLDHRLNDTVAVFARAAHAFRTPNVDERVGNHPLHANFDLTAQTSYDVEGGVRITTGPLAVQSSIYYMTLKNEIHYNPFDGTFFPGFGFSGANTNLDPTRRYGSETHATLRINDNFRLKGSFAYTRAQFRDGPFAGNDVPLVSRFSGSAGFSWNIWQKYLVLDADARFWSSRRMDNDQPNRQPVIPAQATLDLKIGGEVENVFWSFSVNNVFDALYYDYAVASTSTPGAFNAYPLPGRTYLLKAGLKF